MSEGGKKRRRNGEKGQKERKIKSKTRCAEKEDNILKEGERMKRKTSLKGERTGPNSVFNY